MANSNRRAILGRLTAFLAAPFLLGRRTFDLVPQALPEPAPGPPQGGVRRSRRVAAVPPPRSVKRRG